MTFPATARTDSGLPGRRRRDDRAHPSPPNANAEPVRADRGSAKRARSPATRTARTTAGRRVVDGCDSRRLPGARQRRVRPNGGDEYFYVKNDNPGQPLLIAVYDAGFVNTGGFCNTTGDPVGPPPATRPTASIPASLTYPLRYFTNSPYCAGDRSQNGAAGSPAMDTQFSVLAPDGDLDPTNNPVVCSTPNIAGEEPGNNFPFPPDPISPAARHGSSSGNRSARVRDEFHPGHLIVSASTRRAGSGTNNFSLLALHQPGQAPPLNSELSISTQESCRSSRSSPAAALVPSISLGFPVRARPRDLDLDFFDTGDSRAPALGVGVPKPSVDRHHHDSSRGWPTFNNCTIAAPPGYAIGRRRTPGRRGGCRAHRSRVRSTTTTRRGTASG